MNEGQAVAGDLLVAGGPAPVVLDLVPKPLDQVAVDRRMELGAKAAAAASQRFRLGTAVFFRVPAACWCARTMVESRISHSPSGTCRVSNTRCQIPLGAQRLQRFQTLYQLPKRSGRSRQGAPDLAIQRTASTNKRLSWAVTPGSPALPARRSWIRSQCSSEFAWRCRRTRPSVAEKVGSDRPAEYRKCPGIVPTT